MVAVHETSKVPPQESEHRLLKQAKDLLRFFNVDTSEWNKVKAVRWILAKFALSLIVLGFGYYTIWTSLALVLDYSRSPTSFTQKTLFNQSIALPPSIVGLPLSPYELDDYWASTTDISPSANATHYQALLKDYFNNKKITKEFLLRKNNPWPNFLLFLVYHYLDYIMQFETLNGQQAIKQMDALNDSYSDLASSINILDDQLKYLNVSTNDMKARFGAEVKSLFNLTIFHHTTSLEHVEVEVDSYSFSFEGGRIYYNVRFDRYPLKEAEYIQIQAKRSDLPNPHPNINLKFRMRVGIGGLSYGQYDYWGSWFDSSVLYIPYRVASTFRSLPYRDGKQRCSERKSIDLCTSECRREYFHQKCGCFPTPGFMDPAYNDGNVCNLKIYAACFGEEKQLGSELVHEYLIQCENNCLDICERTKYFNQRGTDYRDRLDESPYDQANYSIIRLTIANFDYPVFEETMKWTFPSFLGTIGGAIGLWLGINVLDSISYAVTGAKTIIKRREKKSVVTESKTSEINQTENSNAMKEINESGPLSYWKSKATAIKKFCALRTETSRSNVSIYVAGVLLRTLLGFSSLIITGLALKEYMHYSTKTAAHVDHNESMELPASTICLPLKFGELNELYSSNGAKMNYSTLNDYLNDGNIITDYFILNHKYWNNTVRNVVHAYLIEVSHCEYGHDCNRSFVEDKELASAMDVLESIMQKLNISIDELRQKFGKEVAALYSFSVSLYDFDEWIEDINSSRVNLVESDQICYEVQFNLYPLKASSYFKISAFEYSLPNPFSFGFDRKKVQVIFGIRYFNYKFTRESNIYAPFNDSITYTIELTKYSTLRTVDSDKVRCGERTLDECEAVCRIRLIQDRCKCLPTLWPSLLTHFNSTNTEICSDLKRYYSCPNLSEIWESEECAHQCVLRSCDRLTVTVKDVLYYLNYNNQTNIYIRLDNMNMVTFEERLTRNFEDILGIIGGTVAFLLGYSLFDVLCLTFLLLMRILNVFLKKAKVIFKKKSQVAVIEVALGPNTLVDKVASNSEKSPDNNRNKQLVHELNRIGWYIDKPQWILELIFKLLIIIFFGYLTVRMCMPIILKYKEGSTHSVINLVLNEPLHLKPATLCIELHTEELDGMARSDSQNYSIGRYEAEIQQFFSQSNMTKKNFLGSMNWTNTLLYITYAYFSSISDFEAASGLETYNLTLSSPKNPSLPYFFEDWELNEETYRAMTLLEKYMNTLNITANELRQRLGAEVAALFSLNAYQTTNCQGHTICQNETKVPVGEVTAISWYSICYRMPFDRYPFQHRKQVLGVTADVNSLPKKRFIDADRHLRIYFSGINDTSLDTLMMDDGYLAFSNFAEENHHGVSISTIYQSMISLGKCSEYKTYENCVIECRVALFRQMCNCTPVAWSSWTSSDDYEECRLSNYTSCAEYRGNDDLDCVKTRCGSLGDLCERWVFSVQWLSAYDSSTGSHLVLHTGSFDYPIFKEEYELPFEEFTGAIGGALGFYLGLDFLIILLILSRIIALLMPSTSAKKPELQTAA